MVGNDDFFRKALALSGFSKPGGFNSYALGGKTYGSGRNMPNLGPVSGKGQLGYNKRDNMLAAKKAALLARMQAGNSGKYASAAYLRGVK